MLYVLFAYYLVVVCNNAYTYVLVSLLIFGDIVLFFSEGDIVNELIFISAGYVKITIAAGELVEASLMLIIVHVW